MMMRKGTALVVALGALVLFAAPAQASFHLIKVREVYPGTIAQSRNDAFVELQMFAGGQSFVGGHAVLTYNAAGVANGSFPFASGVAQSDNQRTVLLGANAVAGADTTAAGLGAALDPVGGAVCWDAMKLDCVSWGSFNNTAAMLPTGPAAPAIPDGQSLNRSIAAGCSTLLESGDDTGFSAADFALAAPTPRPNAVTPTESGCTGGGDTTGPETKITKQPERRTTDRKVTFRFSATEPGSSFRCRLDRDPFKPCDSPFKAKVSIGRHSFHVVATDAAGNPDPYPAAYRFKRVAKG